MSIHFPPSEVFWWCFGFLFLFFFFSSLSAHRLRSRVFLGITPTAGRKGSSRDGTQGRRRRLKRAHAFPFGHCYRESRMPEKTDDLLLSPAPEPASTGWEKRFQNTHKTQRGFVPLSAPATSLPTGVSPIGITEQR